MRAFVFLLILAFAFAESPVKLFNGDKVFRVIPTTNQHLSWLHNLRDNADQDFWNEPTVLNAPVDIHVRKNFLGKFQNDSKGIGMDPSVNIDDLQKLIDDAEIMKITRQRRATHRIRQYQQYRSSTSIVGTYPRYNEIASWLSYLCTTYNSVATCGNVGTSYEKRNIPYIKLSTGDSLSKKTIVFECGIHAREWLGIGTGIYMLNRLITTFRTDPVAKRMLNNYDWIFVPLVNPDGYEYSRTDRMWRKNRSRWNGGSCAGVDLNRNYDAWWGSTGSSNNPCSEIYRGPSAFSEPESKAMSVFLNERKNQILAFFTIHTYAQKWLVPYGDRAGHYCPEYSELLRVAQVGTKALMAVNNARWQAGNTVDILGGAAGGGDDYAKLIGIKYSYTLELRPTDPNVGFLAPESSIDPSGREVWAGVTAAVDAMKR